MSDVDILYYILKEAIELKSPTFKDIRDAVESAKMLNIPIHIALPDLIQTNMAFLYVIDNKVEVETFTFPSITVNISKKISEYYERGEDVIGFIHTHSPQSIMPSVSDIYAISELQAHFPHCISAIKRQSQSFYSVFAFKLNLPFITNYFKNIESQFKKILTSVEPEFEFVVPDIEYVDDETVEVRKNLPVYSDNISTMIDLNAYYFLLQNNMLTFSSYNKIPIL